MFPLFKTRFSKKALDILGEPTYNKYNLSIWQFLAKIHFIRAILEDICKLFFTSGVSRSDAFTLSVIRDWAVNSIFIPTSS